MPRPTEAVSWRELLSSDPGELSPEEAVVRHGVRATQMAYVLKALETEALSAEPLPEHPRVFLSHRTSGAAHRDWLAPLAAELTARGYEVVSDDGSTFSSLEQIAGFVAQISTCHFFVSVVDNSYVESVSDLEGVLGTRTWAYVEWMFARICVDCTGLRYTNLVVEGESILRGARTSDGVKPGTGFIARDRQQALDVLNIAFPKLPAQDSEAVAHARLHYVASQEASRGGDHLRGLQEGRLAANDLPESADVQMRFCLAALAMMNSDLALPAARSAGRLKPNDTFVRMTFILAEIISGNGERARALLDDVAHLFENSWRFKALQLGVEHLQQEAHALSTCARALVRSAPFGLVQWSIQWRERRLQLSASDVRSVYFPPNQAIPIRAEDIAIIESSVIGVRRERTPSKDGRPQIEPDPSILLKMPLEKSSFFDLNMILLACVAASWLPTALNGREWDALRSGARPR